MWDRTFKHVFLKGMLHTNVPRVAPHQDNNLQIFVHRMHAGKADKTLLNLPPPPLFILCGWILLSFVPHAIFSFISNTFDMQEKVA